MIGFVKDGGHGDRRKTWKDDVGSGGGGVGLGEGMKDGGGWIARGVRKGEGGEEDVGLGDGEEGVGRGRRVECLVKGEMGAGD